MTLYTNMPLELVLEGMQQERPPLIETIVDGVRLQLEPVTPGVGKIVRLLHGSLNDYLRPELMPGQLLAYGNFTDNATNRS
ncbi:YlzJ-like family protein [Paenibacillus abyssi]|uniref:YlzJ-like protein n=1 Tax=Paenibacillus abyssi TaxID=1340531 RepID=A0A917D5V9_9BACL|nr:YlzJ-like family protein [Paenibacillus abyssi]GGG11880.1 hypothetical protein GCM10010916_30970 [Paenibacillus abyssi]